VEGGTAEVEHPASEEERRKGGVDPRGFIEGRRRRREVIGLGLGF
jgi:hypothetical protein